MGAHELPPLRREHVAIGGAGVGLGGEGRVNAPEVRRLTGSEPTDAEWVDAHADGVVATLLPGLDVDRSS